MTSSDEETPDKTPHDEAADIEMSGRDGDEKRAVELSGRNRRAAKMPVAPRGLPNLIERIRSVADKKYYRFRADEIDAHTDMTNALSDNLQARSRLEQAMLESEEWNSELERKRIRTSYAIEDMEIDAELERRKHELELAAHLRKVEHNRVVNPPKKTKPLRKDFRSEAETLLKHGNAGPHLRAAQAAIEALIKERGSEDELTEEDRERIELLIETARRKDLGKG